MLRRLLHRLRWWLGWVLSPRLKKTYRALARFRYLWWNEVEGLQSEERSELRHRLAGVAPFMVDYRISAVWRNLIGGPDVRGFVNEEPESQFEAARLFLEYQGVFKALLADIADYQALIQKEEENK